MFQFWLEMKNFDILVFSMEQKICGVLATSFLLPLNNGDLVLIFLSDIISHLPLYSINTTYLLQKSKCLSQMWKECKTS